MMKLLILLTMALKSVVSNDILAEVNQKCPCIERQVCLVKSNYQVFSAFQESAPQCPEEKVRCCSETMMLRTLLKIQKLGGLKRRTTGRKSNHSWFKFNQVDLECKIPSECLRFLDRSSFTSSTFLHRRVAQSHSRYDVSCPRRGTRTASSASSHPSASRYSAPSRNISRFMVTRQLVGLATCAVSR